MNPVILWFDLRNDSLLTSQPAITPEDPAGIAEVIVTAPVSARVLIKQIGQLIQGTLPLIVKVTVNPPA